MRLAVLAFLLGLGLAACAERLVDVAPSGKALVSEAEQAEKVSRYRAAQGLGPVRLDPALSRAARFQAQAMARAGVMSHEVAGDFPSRVRSAGIDGAASAENVGMGYANFAAMMAGWKASSGHRRNLLMAQATRVGVAMAEGAKGRRFWALVVASPAEKPVPLPSAGPLVVTTEEPAALAPGSHFVVPFGRGAFSGGPGSRSP